MFSFAEEWRCDSKDRVHLSTSLLCGTTFPLNTAYIFLALNVLDFGSILNPLFFFSPLLFSTLSLGKLTHSGGYTLVWPSQLLKFWKASTLLAKELFPETLEVPTPITTPPTLRPPSGVPSPRFLMVQQLRVQSWRSRTLPAPHFNKMTSSD